MSARLFAVSLLALGAAACGSSSPEVEHGGGAGVRDLLALLPDDTIAVARVDMQALRSSPYAPAVRQFLTSMAGDDGAASDPVIDGADELVFGLTQHRGANGELDAVIVVRGHWAAGEIERTLRNPPEGTTPAREEQRQGLSVFVGEDIEFAQIRSGLWVAASPGRLDTVIGISRAPRTAPVRATPWFSALSGQIGFDQATAAAVADLQTLEQVTGRRANAPGAEMMDQAQWMAASASVGQGASVRAILHFPSADNAAQFAEGLRLMLAQYSDHVLVQMMGVGEILARAQVSAQGNDAVVATRAEDGEVRAILQRLEGLSALAAQMGEPGPEDFGGGDGGQPEGAPPPDAP